MRSFLILCALFIGSAALAQKTTEMGNLSRQDAVQLVKATLAANKVPNSPGLNDKGLGGMSIGGQAVYFEYVEERKTLNVLALVYRFHKPPRPGVVQACQKEAQSGTTTGGGKVEFQTENKGLYLSRAYNSRVDEAQLKGDIDALAKAASHWAAEVIPNVATKVQGGAR